MQITEKTASAGTSGLFEFMALIRAVNENDS